MTTPLQTTLSLVTLAGTTDIRKIRQQDSRAIRDRFSKLCTSGRSKASRASRYPALSRLGKTGTEVCLLNRNAANHGSFLQVDGLLPCRPRPCSPPLWAASLSQNRNRTSQRNFLRVFVRVCDKLPLIFFLYIQCIRPT